MSRKCECGCGRDMFGRHRKWASEACRKKQSRQPARHNAPTHCRNCGGELTQPKRGPNKQFCSEWCRRNHERPTRSRPPATLTSTCPDCGGPKSESADRCRSCNSRLRTEEARARHEANTDPRILEIERLGDRYDDHARSRRYEIVADCLGGVYPVAVVRGWYDRALAMGCAHPLIDTRLVAQLLRIDKVPNAPFRRAMADKEVTVVDLAAFLGIDEAGMARSLGTRPYLFRSKRPARLALYMSYEKAVRVCRALSIAPYELGV